MKRTIKMVAGNKAIEYNGAFYIPKFQFIKLNKFGNRIMNTTHTSDFDIGERVSINEATSGICVKKGDMIETWVYYKHV